MGRVNFSIMFRCFLLREGTALSFTPLLLSTSGRQAMVCMGSGIDSI